MKCTQCGSELRESARFCKKCGARVIRENNYSRTPGTEYPYNKTTADHPSDHSSKKSSAPSGKSNNLTPKIIAGIVSVVLMLVSGIALIADISANASDNATGTDTGSFTAPAFVKAYGDFLKNEKFRDTELVYGTDTDIFVYFIDIDNDGIPELLMTNGYISVAARCTYIFTYIDAKVE